MKAPMWFVAAALLLLTVAPARAQQSAHADIMDSKGQKIGAAQLQQTSGGVRISLTASQLPPGTHGFHIHTVGACDPPDFKTAGPHFNPDNKKHGAKNPDGPHAGDLFNIEVAADGTAHATSLAPNVTLGAGPNSLFHDGGTSLVIHAQADDLMTDPSGNSGARIACGVIQK
jgi:superoxide dismutase, Cu-Zn family